jgi:SAM-dependent methyltransferase
MSSIMSAAVSATAGEELLEKVNSCPLCGSDSFEELEVRNMNSRDPVQARRLAEAIGSDFFVHQRLSVCRQCHHAFQSVRPAPTSLESLYGDFTLALAKVTPDESNMFEYFLRHNVKDYAQLIGRSLEILDHQGLLEGAESALEVRTYGGSLAAMLRERGVPYVEAAYIQEFDALMARRVFGLSNLVPFSFARPISEFEPSREEYDLIVMYEALTHSPDPHAVLDFLDRRLTEGGRAILFREPDNPRYREYLSLDVVFNNFHLNLFNFDTMRNLFRDDGRFALRVLRERHPNFPTPIYFTCILSRREGGAVSEPPVEVRWTESFYRSWIRRDRSGVRQKLSGLARRLRSARRALAASHPPSVESVSDQ